MEPSHSFSQPSDQDPNATKLCDKREKFRLQIRRSSKNEMLSKRREGLMQVFKGKLLEHLAEQFSGFDQNHTIVLLESLERETVSSEFNARLLELKLEGKLLQLLEQPGMAIQMKLSLVRVLYELVSYKAEVGIQVATPHFIDLLMSQLNSYSFVKDFERKYLMSVLELISELSACNNDVVHEHLLRLDIYKFVMKKMERVDHTDVECLEDDGKNILRLLSRIRRKLIRNKFEINFAQYALSQLCEEYSEYNDLCRKEFCRTIIDVICFCPEEDLPKLESSFSNSHLLVNVQEFFEKPMDPQLIELYLKMLEKIEYAFGEEVRVALNHTPLKFLVHCLADSSYKQLQSYALQVFGKICYQICRYYKQNQQDEAVFKILSDTVLGEIEGGSKNLESGLRIILGVTTWKDWSKAVEIFLENGLISKLSELLKHEALSVEVLVQVINILSDLVDYGKSKNEEQIPKILHSLGIINYLEELQNHNNEDVYKNAAKLVAECRVTSNELEHE